MKRKRGPKQSTKLKKGRKRALHLFTPEFRTRIVRDRTKYYRKDKHDACTD